MPEFVFTSTLAASHRDDLERILFFNENQARASAGVGVVVERYGAPKIEEHDGHLRVGLSSSVHPQTLFVVRHARGTTQPVGVAVYTREDDALVVLFIAVDSELSGRKIPGQGLLLVRMIDEIGAIGRRVRGIARMLVYTGRPKPTRINLARRR